MCSWKQRQNGFIRWVSTVSVHVRTGVISHLRRAGRLFKSTPMQDLF